MNDFFQPVELEKAYRLINHGPTILVSAAHDGIENVMAAAWACGLDFKPAKLTVVLDKSTFTRSLIEKSGQFVIQVPTARQAELVHYLGTHSRHNEQDKLQQSGVAFFSVPHFAPPLVTGCAAWLCCDLIPNVQNQQDHDLFIGEIKSAWADSRIFRDGHWRYEEAGEEWRSLHYIAGKHFYTLGTPLVVK